MPPRDADWDCPACKRCLGSLSPDRAGRMHLDCSDEVVQVRLLATTMVPTRHYGVTCVCGVEREFFGYKVHLCVEAAA